MIELASKPDYLIRQLVLTENNTSFRFAPTDLSTGNVRDVVRAAIVLHTQWPRIAA